MKKTSAMRNDEEQSKGYKRRKWLRVASTITAVVSVIALTDGHCLWQPS